MSDAGGSTRGPVVRELTAAGRGAIRVLEVAGPGALERVRVLAPDAPAPGSFRPLVLRLADGSLLDEAVVVVERPERVELHVHGAPALVARVVEELGLQPPDGVPTDLEGRARALLPGAATEAAARMLLDQANGALRAGLERLRGLPDDALEREARELARKGRVAERLLRPPDVVLAGPVNAGKSTLFNLLVGRERVVVDPAAGTTRDPVGERALLGAYAVELHDTAGRRAADEALGSEREGIDRGAALADRADLVLWLHPGQGAVPAPRPGLRVVRSRADEPPAPDAGMPSLSAVDDPEGARGVVAELLHEEFGLPERAHEAGAAVPFERPWTEALASRGAAALRDLVDGWLAGATGASEASPGD